jgi:WD40 repeat protein
MKYKSFISLTTLCSFLIALPMSLNAQTDLAVSKGDEVRKLELVANHNLVKMYQEKADFSFYKKDFRNAWLYALLPEPENKIKAISYRRDGKVVVVKDNNVAYLLDPSSNALISSISSYQPISQIAFSRDGGIIALGLEDSSIEVMDTGSWEQKVLIPPESDAGMLRALAFNHDATLVASGAGYSVNFWDVSTGKATAAFSAGGGINSLAFNNDSSVLVIGLDLSKFEIGAMHSLVEYGYTPTLKFWNTQTQNFIEKKGFGFTSTVQNVLYSPNGRQLIVSTSNDETVPPLANVYIADIVSEKPKSRTLIKDVKGDITNITFSPDSEAVAIDLSDSKVRIFNTRSGEEKTSFNNETGDISLAYNVEGNLIASSSKEGGVTFWSISLGKSTKTTVTKVAYATKDNNLFFWDK